MQTDSFLMPKNLDTLRSRDSFKTEHTQSDSRAFRDQFDQEREQYLEKNRRDPRAEPAASQSQAARKNQEAKASDENHADSTSGGREKKNLNTQTQSSAPRQEESAPQIDEAVPLSPEPLSHVPKPATVLPDLRAEFVGHPLAFKSTIRPAEAELDFSLADTTPNSSPGFSAQAHNQSLIFSSTDIAIPEYSETNETIFLFDPLQAPAFDAANLALFNRGEVLAKPVSAPNAPVFDAAIFSSELVEDGNRDAVLKSSTLTLPANSAVNPNLLAPSPSAFASLTRQAVSENTDANLSFELLNPNGVNDARASTSSLISPMPAYASGPNLTTEQAQINARFNVEVHFSRPEWPTAMAEKLTQMASQNLRFAEIQLDPPELGPVQVRVAVHHDQVSVSFQAASSAVREALDQGQQRLRDMFADEGLNLVDVDVRDQGQQAGQDSLKSKEGAAENDAVELANAVEGESAGANIVLDGGVDHYV